MHGDASITNGLASQLRAHLNLTEQRRAQQQEHAPPNCVKDYSPEERIQAMKRAVAEADERQTTATTTPGQSFNSQSSGHVIVGPLHNPYTVMQARPMQTAVAQSQPASSVLVSARGPQPTVASASVTAVQIPSGVASVSFPVAAASPMGQAKASVSVPAALVPNAKTSPVVAAMTTAQRGSAMARPPPPVAQPAPVSTPGLPSPPTAPLAPVSNPGSLDMSMAASASMPQTGRGRAVGSRANVSVSPSRRPPKQDGQPAAASPVKTGQIGPLSPQYSQRSPPSSYAPVAKANQTNSAQIQMTSATPRSFPPAPQSSSSRCRSPTQRQQVRSVSPSMPSARRKLITRTDAMPASPSKQQHVKPPPITGGTESFENAFFAALSDMGYDRELRNLNVKDGGPSGIPNSEDAHDNIVNVAADGFSERGLACPPWVVSTEEGNENGGPPDEDFQRLYQFMLRPIHTTCPSGKLVPRAASTSSLDRAAEGKNDDDSVASASVLQRPPSLASSTSGEGLVDRAATARTHLLGEVDKTRAIIKKLQEQAAASAQELAAKRPMAGSLQIAAGIVASTAEGQSEKKSTATADMMSTLRNEVDRVHRELLLERERFEAWQSAMTEKLTKAMGSRQGGDRALFGDATDQSWKETIQAMDQDRSNQLHTPRSGPQGQKPSLGRDPTVDAFSQFSDPSSAKH